MGGAGASPGRLFCCSFPRSDNRAGQLSTQSGVYLWFRGRKKEVITFHSFDPVGFAIFAILGPATGRISPTAGKGRK